MKNYKYWLLAMFAALLAWPTLAVEPRYGHSPTSTNYYGVTLNYAIISAYSWNGGSPVITALNATSDKTTAKVQLYSCTPAAICTASNTANTNLIVLSASLLSSNDICVLQHVADDTYERIKIWGTSATTNLITTNAVWGGTVAGDIIWKATLGPTFPIASGFPGSAVIQTNMSLAGTLYVGPPKAPVLLDLDTTATGQINAVTAVYQK
jgi:hypothetical protein